MTFKKGVITNPNGRPKGSKNRTNVELSKRLKQLLETNYEQIEKDLQQLEPNERVKAFSNLLAYVIPKQASINVEAKIEKEFEQLEQLLQNSPSEAVEAIAKRVLEMQEEERNRNQTQTENE